MSSCSSPFPLLSLSFFSFFLRFSSSFSFLSLSFFFFSFFCLRCCAEAAGAQIEADILATGRSAEFIRCDVMDLDDVENLFAQLHQAGPLHMVFNNAGTEIFRPFLEYNLDDYDAVMVTKKKNRKEKKKKIEKKKKKKRKETKQRRQGEGEQGGKKLVKRLSVGTLTMRKQHLSPVNVSSFNAPFNIVCGLFCLFVLSLVSSSFFHSFLLLRLLLLPSSLSLLFQNTNVKGMFVCLQKVG